MGKWDAMMGRKNPIEKGYRYKIRGVTFNFSLKPLLPNRCPIFYLTCQTNRKIRKPPFG